MGAPLVHLAGLWHAHRATAGLRYLRAMQYRRMAHHLDSPLAAPGVHLEHLRMALAEYTEALTQDWYAEQVRSEFRRSAPWPANDPQYGREDE